eukprot:CAMPEP_0182887094 /NCGR_PEP_ID=MMETSP0034_2-20130328/20614_1 /TAXON_ID=156128 /ORGANISM="Nephroselmis pyriformis, Strain CCMP717" /LENGTH=286 /DNA_ID=CAMNT_0025020445 /DNA_START=3 /DNA_END=860 /DNA_ORIENTATION=+
MDVSVNVPSWTTSNGSTPGEDPTAVVFYRVEVAVKLQGSPTPTISHTPRRFSDFVKLFALLRSAYPLRRLPDPPSKRPLSNVNASASSITKRQQELACFMSALVRDPELARNPVLARFIELDKAIERAQERPGGDAQVPQEALDCLRSQEATNKVLNASLLEAEARGEEARVHSERLEEECKRRVAAERERALLEVQAAQGRAAEAEVARAGVERRLVASEMEKGQSILSAQAAEAALARCKDEAAAAKALHKAEKKLLKGEVLSLRKSLAEQRVQHEAALSETRR